MIAHLAMEYALAYRMVYCIFSDSSNASCSFSVYKIFQKSIRTNMPEEQWLVELIAHRNHKQKNKRKYNN